MANFPKYHGITLANNSFIENLVVESLASDPIVTVPGKVWYNTTNKTWNASYLNDVDAVVIRSFLTIEEFQTFVDNLASTSATKGTNLVGYEGKAGANSKFSVSASTLKSSLDSIVTKIDSIANDVDNIGSGNLVAIQNELDTTQAGAGLGTDGTYSANGSSNYLSTATSLKDADNKLDAQSKSLQDELDATQAGAGLGTDGAYTANGSSNYLTAATSLKDADNKLDTQVKSTQNELDATQTGAGLGTDGTYTANGSSNYLTAATSLKDADNKLDAQSKSLQDELDATQTGAGLGTDGTYSANGSANYIATATSLKDADNKLDTALNTEASDRATADTAIRNDFASTSTSKGASLIGVEDSGSVFTQTTVEGVLGEIQSNISGLSLQKVYDSSVPSGNVVTVQLAEDKIIKFSDNNDTTYFQLDPDGSNPIKVSMSGPVNVTGNMTISGNLTVEGSTTEITSTINNADRAPSMYA